jgi:hypothetical protein
MQWRYSVRKLLIASTVLALMIGISAASYRREMALKNNQRSKVEVVYDFGKFRADVRPLFVDSLERGTDFQVISLHPMSYKATPENSFHGWMELGRTTVADASARERLVAAFRGGVNTEREDDDCFEPRHAIRVRFEGQTIDFVICFDCGGVVAYVDSKRKIGFTVGETPQPEFDKTLSAAGVQLAPTAYD